MKPNETFKMTYSAKQQDEINKIRQKYIPAEQDKMALLRKLDSGAEKKAIAVSVSVGIIGTLIMGLGMSIAMSEFGAFLSSSALPVGTAIGLLGIAVLICAYPVYHFTLKRARKKIAPEILKLTEELMK